MANKQSMQLHYSKDVCATLGLSRSAFHNAQRSSVYLLAVKKKRGEVSTCSCMAFRQWKTKPAGILTCGIPSTAAQEIHCEHLLKVSIWWPRCTHSSDASSLFSHTQCGSLDKRQWNVFPFTFTHHQRLSLLRANKCSAFWCHWTIQATHI